MHAILTEVVSEGIVEVVNTARLAVVDDLEQVAASDVDALNPTLVRVQDIQQLGHIEVELTDRAQLFGRLLMLDREQLLEIAQLELFASVLDAQVESGFLAEL